MHLKLICVKKKQHLGRSTDSVFHLCKSIGSEMCSKVKSADISTAVPVQRQSHSVLMTKTSTRENKCTVNK